jgi:hypothetical protein
MNYVKPELVLERDALQVICRINKGTPMVADSAPPHLITETVNAYEADE